MEEGGTGEDNTGRMVGYRQELPLACFFLALQSNPFGLTQSKMKTLPKNAPTQCAFLKISKVKHRNALPIRSRKAGLTAEICLCETKILCFSDRGIVPNTKRLPNPLSKG